MICSYLLHGCDVIRIFKLCIEERGVCVEFNTIDDYAKDGGQGEV